MHGNTLDVVNTGTTICILKTKENGVFKNICLSFLRFSFPSMTTGEIPWSLNTGSAQLRQVEKFNFIQRKLEFSNATNSVFAFLMNYPL